MILQLPATISKINSMAHRSLRIQIDTQENLSDQVMAEIMSKFDKLGWFCFLEDSIKEEDILNLPPLPTDDSRKKSQATRLRAVLYRLWEQKGKQGDSELFYNQYMEKIIDSLKEKLN